MALPTHTKTWHQEQAVPEYKVLHQFTLNLSCNTLKIPKIISFGRNAKTGEYFLEREYIKGEHPTNLATIAKAYSKLIKKMPKPLRQSTKTERSAWSWLKNKLASPPADIELLIKVRTYLSLKANQPQMVWTHTKFLPEHLIQNSQGIYLINFKHVGYRPQYWGAAQILSSVSTPQNYEQNLAHFTKFAPKKIILYNQVALALLQIYRKPSPNAVQWLDYLLNLANA